MENDANSAHMVQAQICLLKNDYNIMLFSYPWYKLAILLIPLTFEPFQETLINAKDNAGCTPLHNAVIRGNYDMIDVLIENGADINTTDKLGNFLYNFSIIKLF